MQSPKMTWAGRVVSVLAAAPFLPSAVMKLNGHPLVVEAFPKMGLPESLIMPIGSVELACVIVYAIPQTALIGAILLTGYLGGAMLTHLRLGEPVWTHIVLGALIWLGLWLREPRLRELAPLRKP